MPLSSRYVGANWTASNWSDAFTTPSTSVASSLSCPRCVVAMFVAARRVSVSRIEPPSAAPSEGSVPEPSSSMSTSESGVAERKISPRFLRWALNVERLASMLCSSPTSAKTSSNTGRRLVAPTGTGTPDCANALSRPIAFSRTVLPPVFGPETSNVRSCSKSVRSNGTTGVPRESSSG